MRAIVYEADGTLYWAGSMVGDLHDLLPPTFDERYIEKFGEGCLYYKLHILRFDARASSNM